MSGFEWPGWIGDLHRVEGLTAPLTGVICLFVSGLCGGIVGLERERREKPAGLRTLILISMGATVFTMSSILIADASWADRGRIAAQVVTGIGFLGAGAIIHERRDVVGLTTAATIWSVAAVGVVVGAGYAFPGIVLSLLIYSILTIVKQFEDRMDGPCDLRTVHVEYLPEHGKTRARIVGLLDECQVASTHFRFLGVADSRAEVEVVEVTYCAKHRAHRQVLPRLADLESVVGIVDKESPDKEPSRTTHEHESVES